MEDLASVIIYIDGACCPNPGPGGWAALLRYKGREKVLSGSEPKATNQRMELTAAVRALQELKRPCRVDIYTDSQYLKRGVTEWLPRWKERHWRRQGGALANLDLWQALDQAIQSHQIEWHWIRGHAGNADNHRVDRLAYQAIPKGEVPDQWQGGGEKKLSG